jgi:hypothetical protein
MKKTKKIVTVEELLNVIKRIMVEEQTQAKYNSKESQWMKLEEVCKKINQRIGNDWVVKG